MASSLRPHRLLPLLALGLPLSARAGGPPVDPYEETDETELFRAEQKVVTVASRYAQTVRQAPSIVTLITALEIRNRGYRTLADLLADVPGVHVTMAKEGRSLAWFRGVISPDNNKILLLVDGVPWYDGVYTHAWIDDYIPLSNVKQVEIIKGPGSAVYGSNAFAGVINVVTFGAKDLQGGFVRAEVGSDGRGSVSAIAADRVGLRGTEIQVRSFARYLDLDGDGINLTPKGEPSVVGTNPRRSINGSFGLKVGGLDLGVDFVDYRHTYFTNAQNDAFDVLFQDDSQYQFAYRNQFVHARYEAFLGSLGTVTPYGYAQRYDNPGLYAFFQPTTTVENEDGSFTTELHSTLVSAQKVTERYGFGAELRLHPSPDHTTVGGLGGEATHVTTLEDFRFEDFEPDPVTPSGFRVDDDRRAITDFFAFAQHTWTTTWWMELTGGLRADYQNFYGFFLSPRAGVLLIPTEDTTVKVLYGRAFRAPNARELLVVVGKNGEGSNLFTAGNPALQPESIDTVETELTLTPTSRLELRTAAFGSFIQDEINTISGNDPVLGDYYVTNRGESRAFGAEAEVKATVATVELGADYAWTHAIDTDTEFRQYGVPVHMAHARATWTVTKGLRLAALGKFVGAQPRAEWSPDAGLPDGEPYATIDLAASTDVLANDRLRVDLSVHNVVDNNTEHLIYLDDANATTTDDAGAVVAKYPYDIQAEGRVFTAAVEMRF